MRWGEGSRGSRCDVREGRKGLLSMEKEMRTGRAGWLLNGAAPVVGVEGGVSLG